MRKPATVRASAREMRPAPAVPKPPERRGLFELVRVIHDKHADAVRLAKNAVECARAAGLALLEAKAQLPHGEWLPWLKNKVGLSERVAQNYMRVARGWDEIQAKANGDSDLTYSGALALLAPATVTVKTDALPGEAEGRAIKVLVRDHGGFTRPSPPPVAAVADRAIQRAAGPHITTPITKAEDEEDAGALPDDHPLCRLDEEYFRLQQEAKQQYEDRLSQLKQWWLGERLKLGAD